MLKTIWLWSFILFLCISLGIRLDQLHIIDQQLLLDMISRRQDAITPLAGTLSLLGGTAFVLILSTIMAFVLLKNQQIQQCKCLFFGITGSVVWIWLLKLFFARPRPDPSLQLVQVYGASYPSAHSMYAASLAALVILIFREHRNRMCMATMVVIWCGLMGLSRVYLGAHYPSDVLAGWSFGICWISFLWYILSKNTSGHLIDQTQK